MTGTEAAEFFKIHWTDLVTFDFSRLFEDWMDFWKNFKKKLRICNMHDGECNERAWDKLKETVLKSYKLREGGRWRGKKRMCRWCRKRSFLPFCAIYAWESPQRFRSTTITLHEAISKRYLHPLTFLTIHLKLPRAFRRDVFSIDN